MQKATVIPKLLSRSANVKGLVFNPVRPTSCAELAELAAGRITTETYPGICKAMYVHSQLVGGVFYRVTEASVRLDGVVVSPDAADREALFRCALWQVCGAFHYLGPTAVMSSNSELVDPEVLAAAAALGIDHDGAVFHVVRETIALK